MPSVLGIQRLAPPMKERKALARIEDKEGWGVATCEPSAANLQLSEDAELLGWKIYKGGEHPVLYPPGVPLPDSDPVEGARQGVPGTQSVAVKDAGVRSPNEMCLYFQLRIDRPKYFAIGTMFWGGGVFFLGLGT